MIYGVVVTKNESDRYLSQSLKRLSAIVDGLYVYDDQSEDDTTVVAESLGATVRVRSDDEESFSEDEARFRSNALRCMVSDLDIKRGDWILSLDADEMVYAEGPQRDALERLTQGDPVAWRFPVREVFDVGPMSTPYIRVDGFWGDISGVRLFKYDGDLSFRARGMGCGSVPTKFNKLAADADDVGILHFGYARQEDRVTKYARYFGAAGHSVKHIDSILRPPVLVRWDGQGHGFCD